MKHYELKPVGEHYDLAAARPKWEYPDDIDPEIMKMILY